MADERRSLSPAVLITGMILLALIVTTSIVRDRIVDPMQWQGSITGRGEVEFAADAADITLGVQIDRASTAGVALSQLTKTMDAVLAAIEKSGIEKTAISTHGYSLYPQYDYVDGTSSVGGYTASQTVTITVDDLDTNADKVSSVITAASAAGANQVQGITFKPSNIEELKQQARLEAIQDAKSKADGLAQALGVRLGRITSWWETVIQSPDMVGGGPYPMYAEGLGGGGGSGTIPTEQQKIIIEVGISYLVK